jgi:hypothetical protein
MMSRATKFASAISVGVVVSAPFATIPLRTVEAAEECLTGPKEGAPPGQHWYYRIERGTKRHCWYLHGETETSSHAALSRRARREATVASGKSEPASTRATSDAHAELGLPQNRVETDQQVPQQTLTASADPKGAGQVQPDNVSDESPQSLVASRWPVPEGVPFPAIEPPNSSSFAVASATPDAKPDASTDTDLTPKAPPVALTSAETHAMGAPTALEMLLLATFGAITISGFAGSSLYLFARMRRRPRSHASLSRGPQWPPAEPAESVDRTRHPPWLEPTGVDSNHRIDRAHDAEPRSLDRLTGGSDECAREIERLLTRFAVHQA